ncbi:hypothetical protein L228DRAFT_246532 [Xylona heveae TC161]|uniref:Uncharacterized protein n=1 Tax=Xylona heveae (strain CBS 132557 / TC161) TaxID=1328760 RepID=A0A165HLF6_XYLHT|nr:hypothetical protein L228DRAFT_246532 [Xylona heveae TC161]KZF23692.1 hypothetical protein L228DRAFT_246532 [Xylona heveae TC161]
MRSKKRTMEMWSLWIVVVVSMWYELSSGDRVHTSMLLTYDRNETVFSRFESTKEVTEMKMETAEGNYAIDRDSEFVVVVVVVFVLQSDQPRKLHRDSGDKKAGND